MVKIGYVRISRHTQNSDSQKKLMVDQGILSDDIFIDEITGWMDPLSRPCYKRMMERINDKEKPKVTEILFSEFSRLGRNAKDSLTELWRLESLGLKISSLSSHEKFINELPPAIQIQILAGMAAGAQMEREHLRERTRWGLENVKKNGSKSGKPIGRPKIIIDWNKIESLKKQYGVSENVARKICGYNETTFYNEKRRLKELKK